jgi:uncharacterized Zn-finger protein
MCDICAKEFRTRDLMKLHRRLHIESERRRFCCHFCGIGFLHKHLLAEHMYVHLDAPELQCERCAKLFSHPKSLLAHRKHHHGRGPPEKRYACNFCPRRFPAPNHLERHVRTHTGERPFPCDLCEQRYSREDKLKEHRLKAHQRWPYTCPVCPQGFKLVKQLVKHSFEAHQVHAYDMSRAHRSIVCRP